MMELIAALTALSPIQFLSVAGMALAAAAFRRRWNI